MRKNIDATHAFVFIHGLFSSINSCWTSRNGIFWPTLVADDERLGSANVFCAEYHTNIFSGEYGVSDCARAVMGQLCRPTHSGKKRPIDYDEIIFVGHSLGGIISRYLLEYYRKDFEKKRVGLVLMASPSIGSEYANKLGGFASLMKFRQAAELRTANDLLRDLDFRFKDIVSGADKWPQLYGAEAVEHKGPFFGLRQVVQHSSAGRYFGAPTVIPKTNHETIVKPESLDSASHNFLVDFYSSNFRGGVRSAVVLPIHSTAKKKDAENKVGDVLFDMYYIQHEPYYFSRQADEDVANNLTIHSLWIHGPSGVGKTSMIRRIVAQRQTRPIEIYLANCNPELGQEGLLNELAESIAMVMRVASPPTELQFNWVAKQLLQKTEQTDIVLFIDEIPISESSQDLVNNIVHLIAKLLATVKAMSDDGKVRFIVSSIARPDFTHVANPGQLMEYVKEIALRRWTNEELFGLSTLIFENLTEFSLTNERQIELVSLAAGVPRFIKIFGRYKRGNPAASFEECVRAARLEVPEAK
jgi:pimeloyl-ACP methyl ester carboxylesterase